MLKNHWFFRIRTARAGRNFENSCRCFSRTYGAIRVILWYAVLKFLRNPLVFEDFGVRARRKTNVSRMVLFDRDDGPGRCATVVAEVRSTWKSCSQKPVWQKCLKSVGFPTNPQERAGWNFDIFFLKNHWFFDVFMLKSLRKLRFWKDFVLRARMCTSCHFLQGILEVWLC